MDLRGFFTFEGFDITEINLIPLETYTKMISPVVGRSKILKFGRESSFCNIESQFEDIRVLSFRYMYIVNCVWNLL